MRSELDDLLDASAPVLTEPDDGELTDALTDLVAASKRAGVRVRKPRRALLVGTTAAVLVAGGTAAAAMTAADGRFTLPWADKPLTSFTFTLPSGGVCEQRVGELEIGDPTAQTLIQEWLSGKAIEDVADVDAALKVIQADTGTYTVAGREIPVGYGTARYDPDYEYAQATLQALMKAIKDKLNDEGYPEYVDITWEAETHCSGSNPTPFKPSWL